MSPIIKNGLVPLEFCLKIMPPALHFSARAETSYACASCQSNSTIPI